MPQIEVDRNPATKGADQSGSKAGSGCYEKHKRKGQLEKKPFLEVLSRQSLSHRADRHQSLHADSVLCHPLTFFCSLFIFGQCKGEPFEVELKDVKHQTPQWSCTIHFWLFTVMVFKLVKERFLFLHFYYIRRSSSLLWGQ